MNKKIFGLTLLVFILISFTLIEEFKWLKNRNDVTFEKSSSYLSSKNRIFVYQVSDTVWSKIENHGKSLEYEDGGLTASFYYLNNFPVPDLSTAKNYIDAIDKGQTSNCVAIYWLNGDSKLVKYPSAKQGK